jgi:hypothetical protein
MGASMLCLTHALLLLLLALLCCVRRRRVTISEFKNVWYVGVREFYEQVSRVTIVV